MTPKPIGRQVLKWRARRGGRRREIPRRRCWACKRMRQPKRWADFHRPGWCCDRQCASRRVMALMQADGRAQRMNAARKARQVADHKARVQQAVGRQFGELSVREVALFNVAVRIGYDRGYGKAYKRARRAVAA